METPPNRILHVPRRFSAREWGGTEAVVSHLCQAQLAQGWQPEIHTSMALDPKPYELFGNIPVHRYRYCYPFLGLSAQARQQLDKKGVWPQPISPSCRARSMPLRFPAWTHLSSSPPNWNAIARN